MSSNNYVTMPPDDLRKMQLIQLEMLIEVDRICKRNKIQYCIIAGTLLGAVRHKGYIPWDDDADAAMLRNEYERFCQVCETDLDSSKFYFQNHKNTPGYRWGYGKIRRVGTQFVRRGQEHMKFPTGVFIDIFPLDNVPKNMWIRRLHNLACTIVRKMLWSEAGAKSDKNAIMGLIYKCLAIIPRDYIYILYNSLMKISNKRPSELVRILTFPTPSNGVYGYYKKWYTDLTDIIFEGHYFPGIREYDEYLTFKFGNYMELPPVEERQGHSYSSYKLIQME